MRDLGSTSWQLELNTEKLRRRKVLEFVLSACQLHQLAAISVWCYTGLGRGQRRMRSMQARQLHVSESPGLQSTWILKAGHGFHSKERKNIGKERDHGRPRKLCKSLHSHSLMPTTEMFNKWSDKEGISCIIWNMLFSVSIKKHRAVYFLELHSHDWQNKLLL